MTRHILFAAYQVNRRSNGGMESATRIFEALSGEFRWTLFTNRETEHTQRWRAGGARVVFFRFDEDGGRLARGLFLGRAMARAFTVAWHERFTLLHANDIRGLRTIAPVAKIIGRPLMLSLRDTKAPGERYGPHWHRLAPRLDALVTLSDDMRRLEAGRLPIRQERVHTIGSVVDLTSFRPLCVDEREKMRKRLDIAQNEVALGMVAGLFDKKRQLEVIRLVMPALADTNARLHLIGDFSPETDVYSRACKEAVEDAGLEDRVVFHGFREEVADWLSALDAVIVASRCEGLARCMIEAMACGTPVVSVDVSSAREMLKETGAGIVVGADDWSGLAQAVRELINNPERRRTMGRAGRAAAEVRFKVDQVAQQWRDLYLRLVDE